MVILRFVGAFVSLLLFTLSLRAEPLLIGRGDGQYPPYEWMEGKAFKGIHIDLITKAANNLGIEFSIINLPWSRGLILLKQGKLAALTFMSKNPERNEFALFLPGNVLSTTNQLLFRLKENYKFSFSGDLNSLKDSSVGVQRGFSYGEQFDSSNLFTRHYLKKYSQVLDMVLLERLNFGLVNKLELLYLFRGSNKLQKIEFEAEPINQSDVYLAFSRKAGTNKIAKLFADKINHLKENGYYQQLVQHYLSSNQKNKP